MTVRYCYKTQDPSAYLISAFQSVANAIVQNPIFQNSEIDLVRIGLDSVGVYVDNVEKAAGSPEVVLSMVQRL